MRKVLITGPAKCGKNTSVRLANVGSVDLDTRFWNPNAKKVEFRANIAAALFHGPASVFIGNIDDEKALINLAHEHGLVVIGLNCTGLDEFKGCDIYIEGIESCVNFLKTYYK